MAVQILNEMPDAEVHRGDPVEAFVREDSPPRAPAARFGGRAGFLLITVGLHVAGALAFMQMTNREPVPVEQEAIQVALIDAPAQAEQLPQYTPPQMELVYSLQTPQEVPIETDAITTQIVASTEAEPAISSEVAPPLVDSVEYIRAEPPVYPKESQRQREHGTVLLRVLVDELGRPAQVQVEHSSGFTRLDAAARAAAEKFLFRPYEVNGVAQPAQVLIPIGFERRSS